MALLPVSSKLGLGKDGVMGMMIIVLKCEWEEIESIGYDSWWLNNLREGPRNIGSSGHVLSCPIPSKSVTSICPGLTQSFWFGMIHAAAAAALWGKTEKSILLSFAGHDVRTISWLGSIQFIQWLKTHSSLSLSRRVPVVKVRLAWVGGIDHQNVRRNELLGTSWLFREGKRGLNYNL